MLEIRSIGKTYSRSGEVVEALAAVTLAVRDGEVVALVGANGSGKSTLLSVISGSICADQGEIVLDGFAVGKGEAARARHFAQMSQTPNKNILPSYAVVDNLLLARRRGVSLSWWQLLRQSRLLEEVRLFVEALAPSLLSRWHLPAGLLSGGEKQLLGLCCATISAPRVLLLDEHTASLDPANEAIILATTRRYVDDHQACAIMSTHRLDRSLAIANRIVLLDGGRVVGQYDDIETATAKISRLFVPERMS